MFADKVGKTMEVYINDMLVKAEKASQYVHHLSQMFETLKKYNIKLNPAKCQFEVKARKFLGYLVMNRGIEANPNQIRPILNIIEPRN